MKSILSASEKLIQGELIDKNYTNDVYGAIHQNLFQLSEKINIATNYVGKIGSGAQSSNLQVLKNDKLGMALSDMELRMQSIQEEEARRNWIVEGLAKFSVILRNDNHDLSELGSQVISNLVKYVEANQGGFFVAHEEEGEKYMELVASYAYNKKKYQEKKVLSGQGILGQCMLEKEKIVQTVVPESYVEITSGLGQATPRNLLILPLMMNEVFYGAIELASFKKLSAHEIEFLEKVGENIASTVATAKINDQTQKLLADSQSLTVELQSREEEMRQNMEELTATQEEMTRKQAELDGVFQAIDNTLLTAEFNREGNLLKLNSSLQHLLGYDAREMDKKEYMLFSDKNNQTGIWKQIAEGSIITGDYSLVSKTGDEVWINATFTPVQNEKGELAQILMLAQDITEKKLQEITFKRLSLVADNTDNAVVITNKAGQIEYVNEGFTKMTGYVLEEVKGKKPGHVLQGEDTNPETVAYLREKIAENASVNAEILNYNKTGEAYWVSLSINPVKNERGETESFIAVQTDITGTKKTSLEFTNKINAISQSNAIIEFDLQGNITNANDKFLKLIGSSHESVSGKPFHMFTKAGDEILSGALEKLRAGEFLNGEFQMLHTAEQEVWLNFALNPITDMKGEVYQVLAIGVDVTLEKKLRAEAKRQELELRAHMDVIDRTIASIILDIDGNILQPNEIYLAMTEYTPQEVIGKSYNILLPQSEIDKPQTKMMWESLKLGQSFSGEFKHISKSGREMWFTGSFCPIPDLNGNFYKVVLLAQFTNREKEKQKDLIGILHALVNSMPFLELTPEGKVKSANEMFLNLVGYKRLELARQDLSIVLDEASGKKLNQLLKGMSMDADFSEKDFCFVAKDGKLYRFKTTLTSLKNLENKVYKIIVMLLNPVTPENHHSD